MFCQHCGTKVDDSANFCPKCGSKIVRATETVEERKVEETVEERMEEESVEQEYSEQKKSTVDVSENGLKEELLLKLKLCKDHSEMVSISNGIAEILRNEITSVQIISESNSEEILKRVEEGTYPNFPSIIVTQKLEFPANRYATFNVRRRNDNEIIKVYHSADELSCHVTGVLSIYGRDKKEVIEIVDKISKLFIDGREVLVPANDDKLSEYIKSFTAKGFFTINESHVGIMQEGDTRVAYIVANLKTNQWGLGTQSVLNAEDYPLKKLRIAQMATQAASFCLARKRTINLGVDRTKGLFDTDEQILMRVINEACSKYAGIIKKSTGFGDKLLAGISAGLGGKDYKVLKDAVNNGGQLTQQMIMSQFPFAYPLFPQLADCLTRKENPDVVKKEMIASYSQYKKLFEDICDYFNLPTSVDVPHQEFSQVNPNMRSWEGLEQLNASLGRGFDVTIQDVIAEYVNLVAEKAEEGYSFRTSMDAHYEETRDERHAARHAAIAGAAAVGVAHHISKEKVSKEKVTKGYKDLKGSAGCYKIGHPTSSCAQCDLYFECMWGAGHGHA